MNLVNLIIFFLVFFIFIFGFVEYINFKFNSNDISVYYEFDLKDEIVVKSEIGDFLNIGNLTLKKDMLFNTEIKTNIFIYCVNYNTRNIKNKLYLVLKEDFDSDNNIFGTNILRLKKNKILIEKDFYEFYIFLKKDFELLELLSKEGDKNFYVFNKNLENSKSFCSKMIKETIPLAKANIEIN